jgi:hypothetical protein
MQIRVCDRCRVEVPDTTAKDAVAGAQIPATLPASAPVGAIVGVTLSVTVVAPADLCPPCRRAAVLEYVAQELLANAGADLKPLAARFVAVLKGTA